MLSLSNWIEIVGEEVEMQRFHWWVSGIWDSVSVALKVHRMASV